jgi:hypothetical protein
MAQIGSIVTQKLAALLSGREGVANTVPAIATTEGIELAGIAPTQIVAENIAPELIERASGARYPSVHVYCERLTNDLREKFRTFSGRARLAAEVRVSQDRLELLERRLQHYVDAITDVLDANRGDWGNGLFYPGAYEVSFGPAKHGGKNFIQTAKVTLEVNISR